MRFSLLWLMITFTLTITITQAKTNDKLNYLLTFKDLKTYWIKFKIEMTNKKQNLWLYDDFIQKTNHEECFQQKAIIKQNAPGLLLHIIYKYDLFLLDFNLKNKEWLMKIKQHEQFWNKWAEVKMFLYNRLVLLLLLMVHILLRLAVFPGHFEHLRLVKSVICNKMWWLRMLNLFEKIGGVIMIMMMIMN